MIEKKEMIQKDFNVDGNKKFQMIVLIAPPPVFQYNTLTTWSVEDQILTWTESPMID